ncbi:unnamed protein product [Ambrosiozyma monospora]|uniref:Unnamed protein product n=1 Tax=Ambrosiozyma monospora TaxID=43982 RepID=A0A9W6WJQ3_AMBMO|nr:unnamed protein product [Ambrosiozyma monospora]
MRRAVSSFADHGTAMTHRPAVSEVSSSTSVSHPVVLSSSTSASHPGVLPTNSFTSASWSSSYFSSSTWNSNSTIHWSITYANTIYAFNL